MCEQRGRGRCRGSRVAVGREFADPRPANRSKLFRRNSGLRTCSGARAPGTPPKATGARARSFGDDVDRLEPGARALLRHQASNRSTTRYSGLRTTGRSPTPDAIRRNMRSIFCALLITGAAAIQSTCTFTADNQVSLPAVPPGPPTFRDASGQ